MKRSQNINSNCVKNSQFTYLLLNYFPWLDIMLQKTARETRVNLMQTRDKKLKEALMDKLSGGIRDFVTNKTFWTKILSV